MDRVEGSVSRWMGVGNLNPLSASARARVVETPSVSLAFYALAVYPPSDDHEPPEAFCFSF